MTNTEGSCTFNQMVNCALHDKCKTCGWNPSLKPKRVARAEKARKEVKMRKGCPFCGQSPTVEVNDKGARLHCANEHCGMADTGMMPDLRFATQKWNTRAHKGR